MLTKRVVQDRKKHTQVPLHTKNREEEQGSGIAPSQLTPVEAALEQQSKERCAAEKKKIFAAMETWRTSFQSSDATLDIKADEFVKSAKCFAESFYLECATTQASKWVAENLKRAPKETKRTKQKETEFTANSQCATSYNVPFDRKFPSSAQFLHQ